MALDIGDTLPDLTLAATGDKHIALRDLVGGKVVIYFYPKDNTPGCTQEGQDFRDLHDAFVDAGVTVLGVSRDSVRTHENFKAKHDFPFDLISDGDESLCNAFGVIVEKTLYGKKHMGIDRSTWLFDADGKLRECWRKVKVKGHAQTVLEAAQAI